MSIPQLNEELFIDTNISGSQENNQQDPRKHCGDCGITFKSGHEEKHRNSKYHLSNTRRNDYFDFHRGATENIQKFKCSSCSTQFTDEILYDNHLGSKTHKRNASKFASTPSNSDEGQSEVIRKLIQFNRKKYKSRQQADVTNKQEKNYYSDLQSYINDLVAHLSLRLAFDRDITDFYIGTDDRKWKSFGDVVIEVTTKIKRKEHKTIYAIKCKQISKNYKQIENLGDAKVDLGKEYASLTSLKNVAQFNDTTFSIFTTCTITSKFSDTIQVNKDVLNDWKTGKNEITSNADLLMRPFVKKNELLNITNEPENVFTIYPKEKTDDFSLPRIYVYTSQKVFSSMSRDILKNTFENRENVSREMQDYKKYIKKWSNGKLGGHHYLNKKDVILKIGEIFLSPYVHVHVPSKTRNLKPKDFEIWNEVTERVDLIIMKNDPSMKTKVCEPLNELIEITLAAKNDEMLNSIRLTRDVMERINIDPMLKAYLFEEQIDFSQSEPDVNMSQLYTVFWKAGITPLLLSTENIEDDKEFLMDVMSIMKSYGVRRKYLLITQDPFSVKTAQRELKIFSRLEDVKESVDLSKIGFHLMNTTEYFLTLHDITVTDKFFLKWITPNIFFELALGNYHFELDHSSNVKTLSDMKITLGDDIIHKLHSILEKEPTNRNAAVKEIRGEIHEGRLRGIDPDLFKHY